MSQLPHIHKASTRYYAAFVIEPSTFIGVWGDTRGKSAGANQERAWGLLYIVGATLWGHEAYYTLLVLHFGDMRPILHCWCYTLGT